MAASAQEPLERLIRLPEVSSRTGLKKATIYRAVNQGLFPRPVRLTAATVGWVESEVQAWIDQRIQEQRRQAAG